MAVIQHSATEWLGNLNHTISPFLLSVDGHSDTFHFSPDCNEFDAFESLFFQITSELLSSQVGRPLLDARIVEEARVADIGI